MNDGGGTKDRASIRPGWMKWVLLIVVVAVIGHVERIWGYSFLEPWLNAPRVEAFVQMLQRLLEGYPVGLAMEYLNARDSRAATEWVAYAMRQQAGEKVDPYKFVQAQTAPSTRGTM